MSAPTCPPDDALAAFGSGRLSVGTADTVRAHLDTCRGCAARLTALSGGTAIAGNWPSGVSPAPVVPVPVGAVPPELAGLTQYEDVRELGRGGMGVVYLARNRLLDRQEVLKVVGRQLLAVPGVKERFLREVQSAARLQHPNVVAAYSVAEAGESLVFAMEYVPGDDLQKVIARGPLPVAQACYFAAQAAHALQHAADKGMVHRDIKPANLMLARDGKKAVVKVLDFGLAKVVSERTPDSGLTAAGQMMGTPDYIAPEQARDAARADVRADIYSLGCTLHCLLAGRPPFAGTSLFDVLQKHANDAPPSLTALRPEVPPALAAVVAKMLAKNPADRHQTPSEVVAALKPFFGLKPAPPVVAAPLSRATAIPVPSPGADATPRADVTAGPQAKTVRPTPAVVEQDDDDEPKATAKPKWFWPAVAGGAVAAVLLLCAAGGLLFGSVFKPNEGAAESDGERAVPSTAANRVKADNPDPPAKGDEKQARPPGDRIVHAVQTADAGGEYGPKLLLAADGGVRNRRGDAISGTWQLSADGKKLVLRWKNSVAPGGVWVDSYTSDNGVDFRGSNNARPPRRMIARLSNPPAEAK